MEEQDRYVEIINYFKYIIKETEKTNNYLIMKTILFSIMESMAQEYSNYCPKMQKFLKDLYANFQSYRI